MLHVACMQVPWNQHTHFSSNVGRTSCHGRARGGSATRGAREGRPPPPPPKRTACCFAVIHKQGAHGTVHDAPQDNRDRLLLLFNQERSGVSFSRHPDRTWLLHFAHEPAVESHSEDD